MPVRNCLATLAIGLFVAACASTPPSPPATVPVTVRLPRSPSRRPWGSETPIRSRGRPVVLVDEAAEQVPPTDIARVDRARLPGHSQG